MFLNMDRDPMFMLTASFATLFLNRTSSVLPPPISTIRPSDSSITCAAPSKSSIASSRPLITSISRPVSRSISATASSRLSIFLRDAVANTNSSLTPTRSAIILCVFSTSHALRMPLSLSTPSSTYPMSPAVILLLSMAVILSPVTLYIHRRIVLEPTSMTP